jgi:glycosyltransferase involved in cell wall biosynthesis
MIQRLDRVVERRRATGDVLVVIPAFNEDRFIGSLVLKVRAAGYSVLVVDDGSSDSTAAVAEAAGAVLIRHASNRGKAAAVASAFAHAREMELDALVLIDGDSQHDPVDLPGVLAPVLSGEADMVVGSRFLGAHSQIPLWRRAGQHALTAATNLGSGVRITDSQSGFRAFSRRAIHAMRFGKDGFSVESEMQFEARASGLTIREVPISVHYQIPNKRNPVRQGVGVLDGVLRLIGLHRPLLFFGLPGLVILAAGLLLGAYVVRVYDATLQLAVGYALITVLLGIVGVMSLFIGIVLHTIRSLFMEFSRRR